MLLCLSAHHRRTPVAVLEHLERRTDEIARAFADSDAARGSVALATCNRFELYLDLPGGSPADAIELLERLLPDARLTPARYRRVLHEHPPAVASALAALHAAVR